MTRRRLRIRIAISRCVSAIFPALALSAFVAGSGCASIGRNARARAIFVQSDPPGATVTVEGRNAGITPGYFLVPRKKDPELYVRLDGIESKVKVETKYRWRDSFFSNLIFYTFAPAGWIVDWASGSAWRPEDPALISLKKTGEQRSPGIPAPNRILIAPPLAATQALSDTGAGFLERSLRSKKTPTQTLVPFEETLPEFIARGSDFDGRADADDDRFLYATLKPDAVWRSKMMFARGDYIVAGELEDIRTRKVVDRTQIKLKSTDSFGRYYSEASRIFNLPNTVTLSTLQQNMSTIDAFGNIVYLRRPKSESWYDDAFNYLSALSISSIPNYRAGRPPRWMFSFFPTASISRRIVETRGVPYLEGLQFARWWVSAGYGPELGYQIGRHYVYANILVSGVWSKVTWINNGVEDSVSGTFVSTGVELGYLYSVSKRWSVRGFFGSQNDRSGVWSEALQKSSLNSGVASTYDLRSTFNLRSGVSLGYSFDSLFTSSLKAD